MIKLTSGQGIRLEPTFVLYSKYFSRFSKNTLLLLLSILLINNANASTLFSEDTAPPTVFVTDISGNELNTFTSLPYSSTGCINSFQIFVQAIDDCDGVITEHDAIWIDLPSPFYPKSTITTNGLGFYVITLSLREGLSEFTIHVKDASGNIQPTTYAIQLYDNDVPEISYTIEDSFNIPYCSDNKKIKIKIHINEACSYNIGQLYFNANGTAQLASQNGTNRTYEVTINTLDDNTNWTILYTDQSGNANLINIPIYVSQSTEEQLPYIIALSDTILVPYCTEDIEICFPFDIFDNCTVINAEEINTNSNSLLFTTSFFDTSNDGHIHAEACGMVPPGSYTFTIQYPNAQTIESTLNITQEENNPASISLPENLSFTHLPCLSDFETSIKISFQDDCDEITSSNVIVTFNDVPLVLTWSSSPFFTYLLRANEGGILSVSYTDSEGIIVNQEAMVSITTQPDYWAPHLFSPTQNIHVEPYECNGVINPVCIDIIAFDNCDGALTPTIWVNGIIINTADIHEDENTYCLELESGEYNIRIQATDNAGHTTENEFIIFVSEVSPPEINLTCIDSPSIPLGPNCKETLTASQVLTGEWACLPQTAFTIMVMDSDTTNGAIIDGLGAFPYTIKINAGIESGNFTQCTGVLQSIDNTPPTVLCPDADSLIYFTGPYDCTASFQIVAPIILDNCSDYEIVVAILDSIWVPGIDWGTFGHLEERVTNDNLTIGEFISNVETGDAKFRYTVTDDFGNTTVMACEFIVIDSTPPAAACDDQLSISVSYGDGTRIYASSFGEGSNDNCGDAKVEIRKPGSDWHIFADFTCADIGQEITLELRAGDDANRDGIIGGEGDLFSICSLQVPIMDAIAPSCLSTYTSTSCSEVMLLDIDWANTAQVTELFGTPEAIDNCHAIVEQVEITINMDTSSCGGTITRKFKAIDDFGLESLQYCEQIITIYDGMTTGVEGTTLICNENEDCEAAVQVFFFINSYCHIDSLILSGTVDLDTDGLLDGVADISFISDSLSHFSFSINGNYPEGNHLIHVQVENGCGDTTAFAIPIEIIDCRVSLPSCIDKTVIPLPLSGGCCSVTLSTLDFVQDTLLDCNGPISYSLHSKEAIDTGEEIPNSIQSELIIKLCSSDTIPLYIYAWDNAYNPYAVQPDGSIGGRNHSFCEVNAVNTTGINCQNTFIITGIITTENDEAIEGAEIHLTSTTPQTQLTTSTGGYLFQVEEDESESYTIEPSWNELNATAINTLDLDLISQHILGNELLQSPYKMIAADVNNSGAISALDIIQLRGLILGNYDEFPNNTFWRFIPVEFNFPSNPLAHFFPETIILNAQNTYTIGDFIGLAIGDIDNSATPNYSPGIEDRKGNGLFIITADDININKGQQYKVTFKTKQLKHLQGYQFTLAFDPSAIKFEQIDYGVAKTENFGFKYLDQGLITTSWNPSTASLVENKLFSLVFTAKSDGRISDFIHLNSRITSIGAFRNNELMGIALDFIAPIPSSYEVYQNTPNPFKEKTNINFLLPNDMDVSIIIRDLEGRRINTFKKNGKAGINTLELNAKSFPYSGVFFYTISTEEYLITKRMIFMKK